MFCQNRYIVRNKQVKSYEREPRKKVDSGLMTFLFGIEKIGNGKVKREK